MFFTLLLTVSAVFTVNVVSIVAYHDENGNQYMGWEPVNEQLKSITALKSERKEITSKEDPKTYVMNYPRIVTDTPTPKPTITHSVSTPVKRKPIKVIHDDWFMKHYDRICQLEAITHRSVLDMYDHEEIFKQFSDLKMLARNLAWEKQQQRAK